MTLPRPIITPSVTVNTSAVVRNWCISKPFTISCKASSLDYARSIIPAHNAEKKLACSRCFQNRLTCAIDCGNTYMLCIECVKSNEEGRNLRKIKIAKRSLTRNIADSNTRRKRARKK